MKKIYFFKKPIFILLFLNYAISFAQLAPRNIVVSTFPRVGDSTVKTLGMIAPFGMKGEMMGFSTTESKFGGPFKTIINSTYNTTNHLYKLDSTGNYLWNKNFNFSGGWAEFSSLLPVKDSSLYIVASFFNADSARSLGSSNRDPSPYCQGKNSLILKTNKNGDLIWARKWGSYGYCDGINKSKVSSDKGIVFYGQLLFGDIVSVINPPDRYMGEPTTVAKYNSDGSLKFNKAFQIPFGKDTARAPFGFSAITETANKGFMMAAAVFPDLTKLYPPNSNKGTTNLLILKIDSNGNKLWDKHLLFNYDLQRRKFLKVTDIIAHPTGGYILVGHTTICEWDPKGTQYDNVYNNPPRYYNFENTGGLMMKISELGNVEWIKSFRFQVNPPNFSQGLDQLYNITFTDVTLTTSGTPGFIMSGNNDGKQQILIKTDLDGTLLWTRSYGINGYRNDYKFFGGAAYEEPGGSLFVNAYTDSTYLPKPTEQSVLRLNAEGNLGDVKTCRTSPLITVYDDDTLITYENNIAFETTPAQTQTPPMVTIKNNVVATSKTGVCVNPLKAAFTYKTYCSGTETMVKFTSKAYGASFMNWNFGDSASGANNTTDSSGNELGNSTPGVWHLYKNSGSYTVTLTVYDTDSSKTDTYKQVIEIVTPRRITFSPGNTTICQGNQVNLKAKISDGAFPPCTFSIMKDNATDYANSWTDTTLNSKALNKTLSFFIDTYGNTCVVSDTITVTVLPTAHLSVEGDSQLCRGDSGILVASGSSTYLWNPGNSINDSLKVYADSTTIYIVSSGQAHSCGKDADTIKVTVVPLPEVDAGNEQSIYPGKKALLQASGGITYLWSPSSGLNSISIANPEATPEQTTSYSVTATDANGCVNIDSITVNVKYCGVDLFVPTAFSPNGDNENDIFYIKTLNNNCLQTIDFKIFDRWGNKVFESDDINIGWNGTYRTASLITGSGKAMNTDVFVYYLNAILETGETISQKGNISLIK